MAKNNEHPYAGYEGTALWAAIEAALASLEENRDVQLSTAKQYVIGSLCQELVSKRLVTEQATTR